MSQQLYNWNRWIACHAWQIFSTSFVTEQRVFFPTQSSVVSCKIPKTVVEFICFSVDEVHRMSSHFCFFFIYFIVALGKCNIAKRAYRLPWASIAAYTSHRQAYFAAGQRPPHRQPLHVTLSPAHAHWHQHQILSHITDKKKEWGEHLTITRKTRAKSFMRCLAVIFHPWAKCIRSNSCMVVALAHS